MHTPLYSPTPRRLFGVHCLMPRPETIRSLIQSPYMNLDRRGSGLNDREEGSLKEVVRLQLGKIHRRSREARVPRHAWEAVDA